MWYANLVGLQFRPKAVKELVNSMSVGDIVQLEREDNAYDIYAIKVHFNGTFIGYLERGTNRPIAEAMDKGEGMDAALYQATGDKKSPWLIAVQTNGSRVEPTVNVEEIRARNHANTKEAFRASLDDDDSIPF